MSRNKSETTLLGPPKVDPYFRKNLLVSMSINVKPAARNLGVIFDSDLSFIKRVALDRSIMFHQLRGIEKNLVFFQSTGFREGHSCFDVISIR